ncbi:MAG TPA: 3-dehydroquinate synthase [Lachnospiraceae bacterium]|nr:3-dehydroquinate synthase [Lachnospiraceae bacterium]
MDQRLSVSFNKKPSYDIVYHDSFDQLPIELQPFEISNKKLCIVTDTNVEKLYGQQIKEILVNSCKEVIIFSFPPGEKNKTLDTVKDLYTFLIKEKIERKDILLAIGGGVVGDLCGYTAATYLRGIDFVQIPTTLLAQVDSSIGGKTGVDFNQYKNMVGAFYMPKLVYMNVSTLKDLDDRQYFAGMGEILKHGLIKDAIYYEWLISNMYEICDRDFETMFEMIYRSNVIKKLVVEKDPMEQGDRALLNFGHTIGHAIEKYMNFTLLHGECVALGCVASAYLSWKKEYLSKDEYYEIRDMFVPFNLPISIIDLDLVKIVELTKSDKKMESGNIKFVLLKKIGKAFIDNTITDEEILDAVNEIYYVEGM